MPSASPLVTPGTVGQSHRGCSRDCKVRAAPPLHLHQPSHSPNSAKDSFAPGYGVCRFEAGRAQATDLRAVSVTAARWSLGSHRGSCQPAVHRSRRLRGSRVVMVPSRGRGAGQWQRRLALANVVSRFGLHASFGRASGAGVVAVIPDAAEGLSAFSTTSPRTRALTPRVAPSPLTQARGSKTP